MSDLRYAVQLGEAARHVVGIELRFAPPTDAAHVDVTLPAWSPGSYLIRDYARYVRDLRATDAEGAPRAAVKVDKSTWRIACAGAAELVVTYAVYGHELSVRTNHYDAEHAFVHPPATFAYPVPLRAATAEIAVDVPAGWTVTSPLGAGPILRAASLDELYDSPLHVARQVRVVDLPTRVPARLVLWGERAPGGTFDEARLAADLALVVDDHIARFGAAPFAAYTFLVMLAHEAYGGLEHRAASVNLFHPHFAASRKAYESLLELLSHELFHAWNGKRIAPRGFTDGAFEYAREAYTPCLWLMEGLTSHYDRFALRTSGRITGKSLLEKILDDWSRLQATPGRARTTLEESSFDAWIKLYRPDPSNLNTTVSYYLKGGLTLFALDLQIRRRTEGVRSLDDVLRLLWLRHGQTGEPHPDDLQPLFEEGSGLALADVFERQVRGTADPDLATELLHVGLELRSAGDPGQVADGAVAVWLGAVTTGCKVGAVFDGSPAAAAGLSPGDEIVAVDQFRTASDPDLRALLGARRPGDPVRLAVFRRARLVEITATLAAAPPTRWEIVGLGDAGAAAARYQAWLGEPHPGSGLLASITTTARWV